jgi:hypothetical protein
LTTVCNRRLVFEIFQNYSKKGFGESIFPLQIEGVFERIGPNLYWKWCLFFSENFSKKRFFSEISDLFFFPCNFLLSPEFHEKSGIKQKKGEGVNPFFEWHFWASEGLGSPISTVKSQKSAKKGQKMGKKKLIVKNIIPVYYSQFKFLRQFFMKNIFMWNFYIGQFS